ncbi:VOC family protein [Pseudobacillus sp. 179-B 2D1 NHS]|uniref:VOC family protein n=1 Tax=Pseudobacillus sp. 179-B 2D1 NHS TaxID=3374292 RepID=UPI003879D2D8
MFDHLVHFVEEPEKAIAFLKEKGIAAVEGGVHENRGTYNAVSYFDLSYIELLSTYDKELVRQTQHPKHSFLETVAEEQFTEGFSRIAIRTTDIEGAAKHFKNKGLTIYGPESFSRKRPDGSLVEWQLLYIGDPAGGMELPFIIQWQEEDAERKKELIERKVIQPHPSKAVLSHVTFAVRDLEKKIGQWAEWLKLEAGEVFIDEVLQAKCQSLELQGGRLVFGSPIGEGIVADVLRQRGERPFQVALSSPIKSESFSLFGGIYQIEKI